MILSDILNKNYSYSLNCIKNCHNRQEKRELIIELINNLHDANIKFSERQFAQAIGISRQLIHDIVSKLEFKTNYFNLFILIIFVICVFKRETRGRKKFEITHPCIVSNIEEICENTKHIDKSLQDEILYTDVTLRNVREKLQDNYGYTGKDLPSIKTIRRIMTERLGYKITKVKKDLIFKRVAETDSIFNNVFKKLKEIKDDITIAAISIDDKVAKYIGVLSGGGSSWFEEHALDHDTNPEYIAKPFGIMDLKTKIVRVFCTISNSTANFKVDCIEEYLRQKIKENILLKKLVIFLDNGPENSMRRKLWIKRIIELSIKYNIVIELVYYPPYCSKYNLIEHFWGVLQKHWGRLIINNFDKLIGAINTTKWANINAKGYLRIKEYQKGEQVDNKELNELIANHVKYSNDKNLTKYSAIITP